MGRYLITGRSGSGKTSVCKELQRRGFNALDGDRIPGLARWVDKNTHLPVRMDYTNPVIDRNKYDWNWDKNILEALIGKDEDVFLCSSAHNQLEFHTLFDAVFVLTLTPEEQRRRILARAEHDYGKHPIMQEKVLAEQKEFVQAALDTGAIPLDAMRPVQIVVEDIVGQTAR